MGRPLLASISETNSSPSSSSLVDKISQNESGRIRLFMLQFLAPFPLPSLPNPNFVTFCGVRHMWWKLAVDLKDREKVDNSPLYIKNNAGLPFMISHYFQRIIHCIFLYLSVPLFREDVLDVLWRRPPQAAPLPRPQRQVQGKRAVLRGASSEGGVKFLAQA